MGKILRKLSKPSRGKIILFFGLIATGIIWHFAAIAIDAPIRLPHFLEMMQTFIANWTDERVLDNLAITLWRVLRGVGTATLIGLPLSLIMGFSKTTRDALAPVMNSIRQIPMMAWVPMGILWFGLGDGPTVFLITLCALFPLMLSTISGVLGIDSNYINAAKSMGASNLRIFFTIILPGVFPSFLTGLRTSIGLGWMVVMCAEFVATSSGFGFLLMESQIRFQTARLFSLMLMAAVVGYAIDRILLLIEKALTSWRFRNAAENQ